MTTQRSHHVESASPAYYLARPAALWLGRGSRRSRRPPQADGSSCTQRGGAGPARRPRVELTSADRLAGLTGLIPLRGCTPRGIARIQQVCGIVSRPRRGHAGGSMMTLLPGLGKPAVRAQAAPRENSRSSAAALEGGPCANPSVPACVDGLRGAPGLTS